MKYYIYNDGKQEVELIMPEESPETEVRMDDWLTSYMK